MNGSVRRLRAGAIGIALVAGLAAACSSGGGSSSPTSAAGSSGAGSSAAGSSGAASSAAGSSAAGGSAAGDALVAGANQEGALTWYTAFSPDGITPIVAAFNKAYPKIKVSTVRLPGTDQLLARITTEQRGGKYNVDVTDGASPAMSQLIQAGALEKYDPPTMQPLDTSINLPTGYQTVIYFNTLVIGYNPSQLAKNHIAPPTSLADFTKPEWKGHFSMDPGGVNLYEAMISEYGHDKALSLLTQLGNNKPVLVADHTQAADQLQEGQQWGSVCVYGYSMTSMKKKTPSEIDFINPNPLPASMNLMDIVKNPPHPDAAKVFIDWIASKEGQQTIVDATSKISLRTDVKNDPTIWNPSKWRPVYNTAYITSADYSKQLKEYQQALKVPTN